MKPRSMKPLVGLCLAAAAYAQPAASLKDAFQGIFRIGAAVNQAQFEERDARGDSIIASQFNTISPENVLKWEAVHPRPDGYNFEPGDKYVAFGEKYHMFIVGHNLVWHSQTPRWVFQDDKGQPLSREALLERMHEHIRTVVGHYKGRIGGWDVVNEALNEDGSMRKSSWYNIIGEDFVTKAFQFAHEADPGAELIKRLQAASVPVAAIGLQGHDKMDWPTLQQQTDTIEAFKALGIKVNITELDVDVLPRVTRQNTADVSATATTNAAANPYVNGLPDDIQQALARRYADLFRIFVKYRGTITRITFWGVTDGDSWLNNFPVRGRTNYPLLFDRQGKPKPAFAAVIQTAGAK
jgi:endo-1,4-beta-xylanase